MIKLQISYENEQDKHNIINALSNHLTVLKVSKPYKAGNRERVYLDIKSIGGSNEKD